LHIAIIFVSLNIAGISPFSRILLKKAGLCTKVGLFQNARLDQLLVLEHIDMVDTRVLDKVGRSWLSGLSLCGQDFGFVSSSSGSLTSSLSGLDAGEEIVTASGLAHVLHTDVDSLSDDALLDCLLDLHTDGSSGNIPHDSGSAMVELVGHTLLD